MSELEAARTFYRLVQTNPPTVEDFMSYDELGIGRVESDEESLRLSSGISVFRTEAQARRVAKRRGFRGTFFIAEISIPADADARIERTKKSPGHFTLWADPDMIGTWLVKVIPVRKGIENEDL